MKTHARDFEGGNTLLEVLIAIVVISLTVVALLGALVTALTSSAEHRSLSTIDTVLKSYAENAKFYIELSPAPWFVQCAPVATSPQSSTNYNGHSIPLPAGFPSGWSAPYIVGVQYWNNVAGAYESQAQCAGQPQPNDEQLLTLGVTAPDGVSQNLTVGLRSPT